MKRAIWLCGLVAFAVAGCSDEKGGGSGGPGIVDIEKTLIELVRADGVPANGGDTAIVRVVARDKDGKTISNRGVEARSSNPNDIVTIEPERTDKNGAAEIHVSATTVGERVLTLSVQGLTMPQRPTVRFVPGDGTYLEFIEAPTVGKAGRPLRPAVRVEVKDERGNRVVDSSEEISLHVGDTVTLVEKAERGVATFSDVVIEEPGEGHRLRATGPGMQEALSDEIDIIVGDPAFLTFERQPVDSEVGGQLSVSVAVRDPAGNVVVGSNETIRIRLYSNPTGAKLEGTLVAQAEEGIATFDGLQINKGSAGYQLTAAASGYQSAISEAFAIGSIDPDSEASTFVIRPNGEDEEPTALANGRDQLRIEGRLFDAHGNPLAGVPVTLSASGEGHRFHPSEEGEGSVLEKNTTAAGTISAWISSTTAELKTVTLRVGEHFEKTATATFLPDAVDATNTELVPQAVSTVVDVDPPVDGKNGGIRFDVLARDAEDNPVPGMTASITASGSENKIENVVGTEISFVTTNEEGVATFWFKSMRAEEKTVTVRIGDVTLSRDVTFMPDEADRFISAVDGATVGQTETVGTPTTEPFRVYVRDRYGNPVPGEAVTFTVEKNNGSLSETLVVADEDGVAETTLTLGTESGENAVSWNAGWDDPREDLMAIGEPDIPHTLHLLTDATDLSAVAGGPGSISLEFEAWDAHGNVTGPATIDFAGDGSFPGQAVVPAWALGASPSVSIDWVLQDEAGPNALTASLAGASSQVVVNATGEAGAPDQILIAGDDSFDLGVTEGPVKLEVQVLDEHGNPVGTSIAVQFAIDGFVEADEDGRFAEGGTAGPPDGDHVIIGGTDDSGSRAAHYSAGTKSGVKTITASVMGFESVATTFTVKVSPADEDKIAKAGGDEQEGVVGKELDEELQVLVTDVHENPVSGVTVSFSLSDQPVGSNGGLGADGDQASIQVDSDANGIASVPFFLGDLPGPYEVTATADGLNTLTFEATAEAGAPDEILIVSGESQPSVVVGEALQNDLVVEVRDEKGNTLEGETVVFSGPADTSFSENPAEVETDSSGQATIKVLAMPEGTGEVEIVASVGSVSVSFEFEAEAGAADSIAYVSGRDESGVWQVGTVGMKLEDPLVVLVKDVYGNPKPGAKVEFKTVPGGQGLFYEDEEDEDGAEPAVVMTDTDGEASILWELPTSPGIYNATAMVLDDADDPIVSAGTVPFVANAELGPPAQLEFTVSDDGEAPVDGSVVVDVEVLDHVDNPLDGVQVDFALLAGTYDASLSAPSAITAGGGLAQVTVQMGTTATAFQLEISAGDAQAVVDLRTLPGAPDELLVFEGQGQAGTVGEALADEIGLRVEDVYDNPIPGVTITISGDGTFDLAAPVTDDAGEAWTTWTLGTAAGDQEATAEVDLGGGDVLDVDLTATAAHGDPATLVKLEGEGEAVVVGGTVDLRVRLEDAFNNPIEAEDVTFERVAGTSDANFAGNPSIVVPTATGGEALATLDVGTIATSIEVSVTAGAVVESFTLSALPGAPDEIVALSGAGETAGVGTDLPILVKVRDVHGNPVAVGESVAFATVNPGDGVFSPAAAPTDDQGEATSTWTLPTTPGAYDATATAGSAVLNFTVTAEAGALAQLDPTPAAEVDATVGDQIAISVEAQDAQGNPLDGTDVEFVVVSGDATLDQPSVTTAGGGQAANQVNLGNVAGRVEVKAFVGSVEALFVINAGADVADTIAVETGDGQSGFEGVALAEALVVRVIDQHGNPVKGEDVTFASADGTASPDIVPTDDEGLASTTFTPEAVGPITVAATIASGTTTQADFAVTGLEAPATFELVAGDRQRINTESRFSNPVVVRALDQNGDPVEGAGLSFTVTDGDLVSADAETDTEGYATAYVESGSGLGDVTVVASLDDFGGLGDVSFDLVAEDVAVCHAAGSAVYYLDAASVLQSHDWVDGAGIYAAAEDTANSEFAYVDFSEAVAGEPAFGFVHESIHLDCDGELVDVVADAAGATITIDGTPADWTVPTGTATYSMDPVSGAFSVSCPGGVGVEGYDDGLDHFTRVAVSGAAGASFCAEPPVAVEMTP